MLVLCNLGLTACATALAALAYAGSRNLLAIYGVLAVIGAIRAFSGPAGQALMPSLVETMLERAVALGSSTWQLSMIAGPSLGGAIYAATGKPAIVYTVCASVAAVAVFAVVAIGHAPTDRAEADRRATLAVLFAGIRYVWSNKPILGAISLDLFAVLLGGAVALLPIFARDFLHTGPWGLGMLRSAPRSARRRRRSSSRGSRCAATRISRCSRACSSSASRRSRSGNRTTSCSRSLRS